MLSKVADRWQFSTAKLITSVEYHLDDDGISIETSGNLIYITVTRGHVLVISDLLGRAMTYQTEGTTAILKKPQGVFFVRYDNNGRVSTKKIFIE
jgi:hypothetical protein